MSPDPSWLGWTTADTGRLNWASTCFYYSLVHLGRMLVFLPFGDFPRGHNQLGKCLTRVPDEEEGSPEGGDRCRRTHVRTDWLKQVAPNLFADADEGRGRRRASEDAELEGVDVEFSPLEYFYASLTVAGDADNTLGWFGQCLKQAKELRENNNYEALLTAHEYAHAVMTEAFRALATTMKGLADNWLGTLGQWFARYLEASTGAPWDCAPEGKIGFAKPFLKDRVLGPTGVWYGAETTRAIEPFMSPITALPAPADRASADHIERRVNFDMFSPKRSLMRGFAKKVGNLGRLLGEAPGPRPQSS